MSARFIVSEEIEVTIYDNLSEGGMWVEVEVKVTGPDQGTRKFEADIANGAVKVKDKIGYRTLGHYAQLHLMSEYDALI